MFWLVKLVSRLKSTGTTRKSRYSARASTAMALSPMSWRARRAQPRKLFIEAAFLRRTDARDAAGTARRECRPGEVIAGRGPPSGGRGCVRPVLVELLHLPGHVGAAEERLGGGVEVAGHGPGQRVVVGRPAHRADLGVARGDVGVGVTERGAEGQAVAGQRLALDHREGAVTGDEC